MIDLNIVVFKRIYHFEKIDIVPYFINTQCFTFTYMCISKINVTLKDKKNVSVGRKIDEPYRIRQGKVEMLFFQYNIGCYLLLDIRGDFVVMTIRSEYMLRKVCFSGLLTLATQF